MSGGYQRYAVPSYTRPLGRVGSRLVFGLAPNAALAVVKVVSWRFRNDDGNETTATWQAAERTNVTIVESTTPFRVRFEFQETGGGNDTTTGYHLKYTKNGGAQTDVAATSGTPTDISLASSTNVTDGQATTDQLTAGTGVFVAGEIKEDSAPITGVGSALSAVQQSENEWVLKLIPADVTPGDVIELRAYDSQSGLILTRDTGVFWPSFTVGSLVVPDKKPRPFVIRQAVHRASRW